MSTSNCGLCTKPDTIKMVQCDVCDSWFHFKCVNVTSKISQTDWKCKTCSLTPSTESHAQPDGSSITPQSTLQISNQNCKICKVEDNLEMTQCSKCKLKCHVVCAKPTKVGEIWICLECTHQVTHSSKNTNKSRSSKDSVTSIKRRELALQKLEEEREMQEKRDQFERELREKRDQEYLNKKFEILESQVQSSEDEEFETISSVSKKQTIEDWLENSEQVSSPKAAPMQSSAPNASRNPEVTAKAPEIIVCSRKGTNVKPASLLPIATNILVQQPMHNDFIVDKPTIEKKFDSSHRQLQSHHFAARQATSKDLPFFNGEPEEWPLFISIFENSTKTCQYSNEENLLRLQRCLKGKAMESVRCRLLLPDNVPKVISTLRMLFGRPEIIINNLIQKLRHEPAPKADKLETIVKFSLSVENLIATMEASHLTDHLLNPILLQELTEKLPVTLKLNWAVYKQVVSPVTLSTFSKWLSSIAEAVSEVTLTVRTSDTELKQEKRVPIRKENGFLNAHASSSNGIGQAKTLASEDHKSETEKRCCVCSGTCAAVEECAKFGKFDLNEKWNFVKEFKLCRTCLSNHGRYPCRKKTACGKNGCVFKHHNLLHDDKKDTKAVTIASNVAKTQGSCHSHQITNSSILFRIVPVELKGPKGTVHTFAFLDDGSSVTLIEDSIVSKLGLRGTPSPLCLKWTADMHRQEEDSQIVSCEIAGRNNKDKRFIISNAHTVKSLDLPMQTISTSKLCAKYPHLRNIPVESYENSVPQILIGLNNWKVGIPLKVREGNEDQPVASKTRLGWIVYGPCDNSILKSTANESQYHSFHMCECQREIDNGMQAMMKDYLLIDSLGVMIPTRQLQSVEVERSRSILETMTKRQGSRFETGLLWKRDNIILPDSLPMAQKRFQSLEKKLSRDPNLAENLKMQISSYVDKNYARKLSEKELQEKHARIWYLPIFPVTHQFKPGKVRIVWDAAAKVAGTSLNSVLLKGPDLLSSLLGILMRFREKRVAICGDIREMYHQVRIQPADQHCQRFLWRDHPISVYALEVMTFGATCSPSCAQYVMHLNAQDFTEKYPGAVNTIINNHYVDDLLESVDTPEEAIQLAKQVALIHSNGGFVIRNWVSNSSEVVAALEGIENNDKKSMNLSAEIGVEKVLGMWWCTKSDTFMFKFACSEQDKQLLSGNQTPTKRDVLRTLMKVFDPLGLLGQFMVFLKIILQEIWRSALDWDEKVEEQQCLKWEQWIKLLPQVSEIRIPRCYQPENFCEDIQLHIFVDASEQAFATVAYLRFRYTNNVQCALVGSKTRVAPLKLTSIPRLELEAALLGTRFSKTVRNNITFVISSCYYWSDSKTVLCWLRSDQRKYKQYVAFRVGEIMETTNIQEWRWIPSKMNVADDATKWVNSPNISENNRWYKGPEFLRESIENWPVDVNLKSTTEEEMRAMYHHSERTNIQECLISFDRFSSWKKLIRTQVYISRFIQNTRSRSIRRIRDGKPDPITKEEYFMAEVRVYKQAQLEGYPNEVATLKKNAKKAKELQMSVDRDSKLLQFAPYIDDNGLIRVGGRVNSLINVDEYARNPIVLPLKHYVTDLIIMAYHLRYHHVSNETVVNEIRQKFSILRLRVAVKLTSRRCQMCKIRNAKPNPPRMADLPPARLQTFTRPFSFVGIDYFGPMNVTVGRRTEKRWGVLLTCLTTRAVHLEIAHSLTTGSCILCIRNFMARRGVPVEFYSDNGTNFHGADKELKKAWQEIEHNKISSKFTNSTTKWLFNPPAAPHMGGSWERLVRSVKKILLQIKPSRTPSDELLRSLLMEVESIINSRPLTYIPLDHADEEALTPNHFLLGSSSGMKQVGSFNDDGTLLRKNWTISQQMANAFWKRWVREYMPTLTRRAKWFSAVKNIEKDDIVVIVDENSPRNTWPKGKVIETIKSKDGQVRRVIVKTTNGLLERPAVKIALLDVKPPNDLVN